MSSGESSGDVLIINVRMNTVRFSLSNDDGLTEASTVLDLKKSISTKAESEHCEVDRQRLIYKGRILSDNTKTLADYGIKESDQTVHLVKSVAPTQSPNNNNTNNTQRNATPTPTSSAPSPPADPNLLASLMQSNPFAGGSGAGLNSAHQQMLQNPELMSDLMSSPFMQNLMSNPDFMSGLMQSNPQMRQLMDTNPELRQIMQDPEIMRRSIEMMRNPSAMNQMMRNQDLAMSQIENLPGGFNALRRMYEEVQDPLMDAMANGATSQPNNSSSSTSSDNPPSTSNGAAGAAGAAMPNPWGSPSASARPTPTPPAANPFLGGLPGTLPGALPGAQPGPDQLENAINFLEANPMLSQMMNQMLANPQTMEQLMASNPMFQQLRQNNPMMANLLNNPETMRAMMNPSNLRAMANLQSSMQQLQQGGIFPPSSIPNLGAGIPAAVPPNTGTPPVAGGLDFSSLLNQFQGASVGGAAAADTARRNANPEERYRAQLRSLEGMGFDDQPTNIRALDQANGSLNGAVDILLSGSLPAAPTDGTSNADTPGNSADSSSGESQGGSSPAEK